MNWKPINKVIVGSVVGLVVVFAEQLIPSWHHGIPAVWQTALPFVSAMTGAYLTKLEAKFSRGK